MTVPVSNMVATMANTSYRYDAIGMDANTFGQADGSNLINLKANGVSKFAVDIYGNANVAGSLTVDSVRPGLNDGGSLGISGTAWSDLFLASGAVINWGSGDVTLTHASGILNSTGNFAIRNAQPTQYFYESDAPTDEKDWYFSCSSGDFALVGPNEAYSVYGTVMLVQRTGATIDLVKFPGTQVEVSGNLEIGHASDTTLSRSAAGVLAVENKIIKHAGKETIWVPANVMTPTTTNGAASSTEELATNDVMLSYLAFDSTTRENACFQIQMPKSWDEGTLIAQFVWKHPSTATNFGVFWRIEATAFADGDALDSAWGTEQTLTDTGGTTNDCYISPETSPLTVGGSPGAEELVVFRVSRGPADVSDTLAVDAQLLGVKIHYTTNAANDD